MAYIIKKGTIAYARIIKYQLIFNRSSELHTKNKCTDKGEITKMV